MNEPMYELFNGDCIQVMDDLIKRGIKVDVVITDPPFGTTDCSWDSIIDFNEMWSKLNAITKDDGAIVLFGSEPFSTELRKSNLNKYRYDWYWIKQAPTGFGFAKFQPMRDIENIMVFKNKKTSPYYPQGLQKLEKPKIIKPKKQKPGVYEKGSLHKGGVSHFTGYPKNTLYFKPQRQGIHPTQKPVDLLEYLIKTYTKEGELVLDFTMGSGSTIIAALNTNRRAIGIELDDKYFNIAKDRIEAHKESLF